MKANGNMKAVGPGRKPRPDDSRGGNQGSERGIPAMARILIGYILMRYALFDLIHNQAAGLQHGCREQGG